MAQHHIDRVRELWHESVLFNFVAYWKNKDLMDEAEYQEKYWSYGNLESYVNGIVDYIHDAMSNVIKWLSEFEIERKFLIKKLPQNITKHPSKKIIQWYFKDKDDKKIRLRKVISKWLIEYFQTIKQWHGLIRKELEEKISKETFEKLWKKVWNRYLEKTRYVLPYKKQKIELDIYQGKLNWLITSEIEFKNPLESRKFIVPKRFDKELTGDRKYSNASLAKK